MSLRKRSSLFCSLAAALLLGAPVPVPAQPAGPHVVSIEAPPNLTARRNSPLEISLKLTIRSGYHINSHTPAEEYLIPTVLNWDASPLGAAHGVDYPKAETVKYEFADKPLSVYSGTVAVVSHFAVPASASRGEAKLTGKLRYQACTDRLCLPPRTLNVTVPVQVE